MSKDSPDDVFARLPAALPIFPLNGVLLLPHGLLPLHIFEPRYLNMIEECLSASRMLGMVQPRGPEEHPIANTAEVFQTGCAGRIISFSETEDGRFLITLRGVCRFRIVEELPSYGGFRRITPNYEPFRHDLVDAQDHVVDRSRLLDAARAYLQLKNIACDWSTVEAASDQALVTSFAMMCPFEAGEKQALLECAGLVERGEMLISLFEMALHEGEAPLPGARH